MNSLLRPLKQRHTFILQGNIVFFNTGPQLKQISRPTLRKRVTPLTRIEPFGWFMLIIPAASFGLGVWQVQRKSWKENLIAEMQEKLGCTPKELPRSLNEIKTLEYQPVRVRGTFLHDKEIYLGPRALLDKTEDKWTPVHEAIHQGYLVITPFKLADRDETILINRGWVPSGYIRPKSKKEGQVEGVVDVIGIIRLHENRPAFGMKNQEQSNLYFYRDLDSMCAATGASPIFLDQTVDYNIPGGPIGGQTRVTLRNEHMSYIITWFSLSAITCFMWFKRYVIR